MPGCRDALPLPAADGEQAGSWVLIVIDYPELMEGPPRTTGCRNSPASPGASGDGARAERAVIALSQLTAAFESAPTKRPMAQRSA